MNFPERIKEWAEGDSRWLPEGLRMLLTVLALGVLAILTFLVVLMVVVNVPVVGIILAILFMSVFIGAGIASLVGII